MLLIAIFMPALAIASELSVEQSKWDISVGFLKCEKYSVNEDPKFLIVYSPSFEGFQTANSREEYNAWVAPEKELAGPDGTKLFFHEWSYYILHRFI